MISVHDLGFHLKAGHWIAEHHQVPQADTFTYTVGGQPYVDSHWLYQLAIYGLYRWGGYGALTLGHVGLILAGFLLLTYRCRETQAPDWLLAILMAAAVFIMERRFLDRPEVASWLLLGATLWVLEGSASGKKRPLWLLPLIQLVWANTEGLFVLGWIAMGAFWAGRTKELKKPDLKLSLFLALSIAADFMNPNFLKGVLYPFSFVSKLGGDMYNQTVMELQSLPAFLANPSFAGDSKVFIYLFCLYFLLFLAITLATLSQRKVHELLMAAAFFCLAFRSVRNIPLAMIVTLPAFASAWVDLTRKEWIRSDWFHLPLLYKRALPILFSLGLALWGCRVVTDAYYRSDIRAERFGLGLDEEKLPVEASLFMAREHLDGRILNSPNFGAWLEWSLNEPVFMDTRWEVMGESLYRRYLDMTFSKNQSMGGLGGTLIQTGAQIVVFEPRIEGSWGGQLIRMPDWRLVYLDDSAAIYLKKGYRDDLPDFNWEGMVSSLGLHPVTREDLLSAFSGLGTSSLANWVDGFYRKWDFPWGLLNRSLMAQQYGKPEVQLALDLEMVRRTGGFERPFLEMVIQDCMNLKNTPGARMGFQRLLQMDPGDKNAMKGFFSLSGM
jgi:hypothetical protein